MRESAGLDESGGIAQLGERLLCKQEVTGSIPVGSTSPWRGARPKQTEESAINSARRTHANPGGAGRDRTDDPLLAKQVLSQLSYSPFKILETRNWKLDKGNHLIFTPPHLSSL